MTKQEMREMLGAEFTEGYNNSFDLLTRKATIDDIINRTPVDSHVFFITSPEELRAPWVIEEMIEYFIETEEYEKCAELKKILDKINVK